MLLQFKKNYFAYWNVDIFIFFSESIKNNSIPSESFAFMKFIINVTDTCLSHIYYIRPFFRCVSWSRSFFCAFNWGGFFIQFSVQFVQCYSVSAFYGNYIWFNSVCTCRVAWARVDIFCKFFVRQFLHRNKVCNVALFIMVISLNFHLKSILWRLIQILFIILSHIS